MMHTIATTTGKQVKGAVKVWGVVLCFIASFLFLAFQGGKLAYMLFFIVTLLCIYFILGRFSGITAAQGSRSMRGNAKSSEWIAGSAIPVQIHVQLPRFWLYPYIIVKDRLVSKHGDVYDFESTFIPDWRSQGQVQYVTPPLRRGIYSFDNTRCTTEDVFGMFQHHGTMLMEQTFSVLPQTVAIKEWSHYQNLARGSHQYSTSSQAARETTQINGVRDYVYGDRISRIHWNATARTGEWKSKEFEKETLPRTIIVLDGEKASYSSSMEYELAVSIAASLFNFGTQQKLTLGLLSTGEKTVYIEPTRGELHTKQIISALVQAEANGKITLEAAYERYENVMPPGTLYIFITPRYGDGLAKSLRLIRAKQTSICHIWLNTSIDPHERNAYIERSQRMDYVTYPIASLAELPIVLGRRGA